MYALIAAACNGPPAARDSTSLGFGCAPARSAAGACEANDAVSTVPTIATPSADPSSRLEPCKPEPKPASRGGVAVTIAADTSGNVIPKPAASTSRYAR